MSTATVPPLVAGSADARPPVIRSRDPRAHSRPTSRDEGWRYLPLARLGALLTDAPGSQVAVSAGEGVIVHRLTAQQRDEGSSLIPGDWCAAHAYAASAGATVLEIPAEATGSQAIPVRVALNEALVHDHLIVRAGAHSDTRVELVVEGAGAAGLLLEVHVGRGARLRLVLDVAVEAAAALLIDGEVVLDSDATFTGLSCQRGGAVVRTAIRVVYRGQGARAELLGLNVTGPGQHHESRPLIHHTVPRCSSDVAYKGVVHGQGSHEVWVGDVIVDAEAVGIDTYELNRTILLDDGARADSVPNLELKTGDVLRAGHASVTGRLDAEQMFYLQARGLPAHVARQLIIRGFFTDLLDRVGDEALAERLLAALDEAMASVDA